MTDRAQEVLRELQRGKQIAIPSVYPHALVFSDHARLYFENAAQQCKSASPDFGVFGALYSFRHGLELWIKCLRRNVDIDRFLTRVFSHANDSLDQLADAIGLGSEKNITAVREAICVLRNLLEDERKAPECWNVRMEGRWAEKGLAFMRANGDIPRQRFATLWSIAPDSTHDLKRLWRQVPSEVMEWYYAAQDYPNDFAAGMIAPDRIAAFCDFFHSCDPDGDAFRYPVSLSGKWRVDLPPIELDVLGDVANAFAWSTVCYREARESVYQFGTLADPRPGREIG